MKDHPRYYIVVGVIFIISNLDIFFIIDGLLKPYDKLHRTVACNVLPKFPYFRHVYHRK